MAESSRAATSRGRWRSMLGLILAFASAIFGALMTLLVKMLQEAEADHLLLVRWFVQYIFTLPILTWRRETFVPDNKKMNLLLFVASTICVFASNALFFSVTFLPVGDALAIMSTYVVLVGFFACVCLKERCGAWDGVFAVLALVGLVFVARPPFIFGQNQTPSSGEGSGDNRLLGILLAVAASLFSAVTMVTVRRMGDRVHYSLFLFYFSTWGLLFNCGSVLITGRLALPCAHDLLVMFLSAFAALLNTVLVVLALQNEAAGPVTIVCTSEVVFAFLLEFLFLGTVPSAFSVVGAGLIMASCVGLALVSIRNSRNLDPGS